MTCREALERFVETHMCEYSEKYVTDYVLNLAPHLKPETMNVRLLNFTTNVKRKNRGPGWYADHGYNLLFLNRALGLYTRYINDVHPDPVV